MTLTPEQLDLLMKPLHPSRVKTRNQGGATLSYLEAADVKAMLIRVFGFGGFSADVTKSEIVDVDRDGDRIKVSAMVTLRLYIHQLNATYTETSVAGQTGRSFGEVADFAIKTAESDALKRACIYLGSQFGLGLYFNGSLAEPVKKIFAPGQEWEGPVQTSLTEEQKKNLEESLGAVEIPHPYSEEAAQGAK